MTLVSGNKRYMRILAGVPLGGTSNESVVVDDSNFWLFEWLLLRDLQRQGRQYYMTICYGCYPLWLIAKWMT